MNLSLRTLSAVANCTDDVASMWLAPLSDAMQAFDIESGARVAAFLAQVVHESHGLTVLSENLNYSAKRLAEVWPSHFAMQTDLSPGLHDAVRYAYQPEALANLVYANRMGNGAPASGDGWRFRGRGLIQLTGKTEYTRAAEALQLDLVGQPDLLLQPELAARSAAWYWSTVDGNALADQDTLAAFEKLTVAINGQTIGLQERVEIWKRGREMLCGAA